MLNYNIVEEHEDITIIELEGEGCIIPPREEADKVIDTTLIGKEIRINRTGREGIIVGIKDGFYRVDVAGKAGLLRFTRKAFEVNEEKGI